MEVDIRSEIGISTSRSGGKGGQNVNKVETQVEARFNIETSTILSYEQKEILLKNLATKLSKKNELIVVCNESRTQLSNKEKAIQKLILLIQKALIVKKARKKTAVPKGVKEARLQTKRRTSDLKKLRKVVIHE